MPKRFLNVEYSGIRTRIDVTQAVSLGDVQDAVKAKYGDDVRGPAARIQLYDQQGQQITTWAVLNSLAPEYFAEGGSYVVLQVQALNNVGSPQSSITSISCCSNGRHTDRNKRIQKKFKKNLVKRDTSCIATGFREGAVAAHIIPLNKSELIALDLLFSLRNGILLHQVLKFDYDRHKWFFDYDGNVTVLYSNWIHKNTICHVNVSKDPETGPSKELIELHNRIALEKKQHHCPNCWKYVGAVNIENHTSGSCEAIDNSGDEDNDMEGAE